MLLRATWLLILALAPLLAGCGMAAREELPPLEDEALQKRCEAQLRVAYPEHYRLRQRIRLEHPGGEEAFNAYLWAEPGPTLRALAFAPMAGKWLDLRYRQGETTILVNRPEFPERLLTEGVMGDILHLNGVQLLSETATEENPGPEERWEATPEGGARCVRRWPNGAWSVRDFSEAGRLLVSEQGRGRQVDRIVSYEDYRPATGWKHPLPHRIKLDNPRWRYRLDINLISVLVRENEAALPSERR